MLPLVTLEGRATADPELRFAPSGMAIGRLRMACSSRKKNEADQWVDDKTLFIDVTMFRTLAENTAESVVKGDLLTVVGRLQTENWETQDGEKRSKIALIADSVAVSLQFRTVRHGEGKAERQPQGQGSQQQAQQDPWATGPAQGNAGTGSGFNEDPPF